MCLSRWQLLHCQPLMNGKKLLLPGVENELEMNHGRQRHCHTRITILTKGILTSMALKNKNVFFLLTTWKMNSCWGVILPVVPTPKNTGIKLGISLTVQAQNKMEFCGEGKNWAVGQVLEQFCWKPISLFPRNHTCKQSWRSHLTSPRGFYF